MSDFLAPEPELRGPIPRRVRRRASWPRLFWSLALLLLATAFFYFNARGALLEFLTLRDGISLRGAVAGVERHAKSWNVIYRFRAPGETTFRRGRLILSPDEARQLPVNTPVFVRFRAFSSDFSWHVGQTNKFSPFDTRAVANRNLLFCFCPVCCGFWRFAWSGNAKFKVRF